MADMVNPSRISCSLTHRTERVRAYSVHRVNVYSGYTGVLISP